MDCRRQGHLALHPQWRAHPLVVSIMEKNTVIGCPAYFRRAIGVLVILASACGGGSDARPPQVVSLAGVNITVQATSFLSFSTQGSCDQVGVVGLFTADAPPMPASVTVTDAALLDEGGQQLWNGMVQPSDVVL